MPPDSIQSKKIEPLFTSHREKRSKMRRLANDLSQIQFDNQLIGCLIHNLSNEGAMIEVSTSQVPDRFVLVNYAENKRMACKVVWRDHLRLGVEFLTTPKSFNTGFS